MMNMGLFPVLGVNILAGAGQTISFNSITGFTLCGTPTCGAFNSSTGINADGSASTGLGSGGTSITSNTGISGISFARQMFLVGVFLGPAAPTAGTQPSDIPFFTSGGGYDADNRSQWFSPLGGSVSFVLGQSFYIGDGKTGVCTTSAACAGTTQVWNVPSTATRLFLGFADGGSNGPFSGSFGAYDDNVGSLSVDINTSGLQVAPEPGTIMLMGLGMVGLALLRKKIA
jgi:hypothetical protein